MTEYRATICVCSDFDALSMWMDFGAMGARALSRGEFGPRVGAPRLLDVLDRFDAPSTWFIPGHTAETFPEITKRVADAGHEIANHGYHHESFDALSIDEGRHVIKVSNDALERITGQRPVGFRHPTGDLAQELLEVFVEEGFSYDSSLAADDFYPYWARGAWTHQHLGPSTPGPLLDLVEIPHSFVLNDFHHFEFTYDGPKLTGRDGPAPVEAIWRAEWEYLLANAPGGIFNLVLHPESIGRGLRIAMLERFLRDAAAEPGVRFATLATVAEEFRAAHPEGPA
ncbi:MAG: polysaccharide deacetylase [Baekduiaceae bacterium]